MEGQSWEKCEEEVFLVSCDGRRGWVVTGRVVVAAG